MKTSRFITIAGWGLVVALSFSRGWGQAPGSRGLGQPPASRGQGQPAERPAPTEAEAKTALASLGPMEIAPVAAKTASAERSQAAETAEKTALVTAIQAYETGGNREDFSAMNNFVRDHPESPYRAGVLVNTGELAYRYGYYTKAIDYYERAWNLSKGAKAAETPEEQRVVAGAGIRLAGMYARTGRRLDLRRVLAELEPYPKWGTDANLYEQSMQALGLIESRPDTAYKCGPFALINILRHRRDLAGDPKAILAAEATPDHGFEVGQLEKIAQAAGMNFVAVRRPVTEALPLPAVVHWKVGHYAAVLEMKNGRYLIKDPTFGTEFWMSATALDEEASGVFLVPAANREHAVPGNLQAASAQDRLLTGKSAALDQDIENQSPPGWFNEWLLSTATMAIILDALFPDCHGMAAVSYNLFEAKAFIADTPLWFTPPEGPPVAFTISYYEGQLPDQISANTTTIGSTANGLWTMNFLSAAKVVDLGNNTASLFTGDGRKETYHLIETANLTVGNHTGNVNIMSGAVLERLSGNTGFVQHGAGDDTVEFTKNITIGGQTYFLATAIKNAQGVGLTLNYTNGTYTTRLVSVTDAMANTYTMQYGNGTYPYRLTGITSGFGNVALTYDSNGRLTSITDPAGITSSFAYGNGTYPSRVTTVTTPYGNTTLESKAEMVPLVHDGLYGFHRSVLVTYPDGAKERVTYGNPLMPVPHSAAEADVSTSIYFGKRAMFQIEQGGGEDLLSRELLEDWHELGTKIFWHLPATEGFFGEVFDPEGTNVSTGVPLVIITPLDTATGAFRSRIYMYNKDAAGIPILSQPIRIQDGNIYTKITYNELGNPLTITTPVTDNGYPGLFHDRWVAPAWAHIELPSPVPAYSQSLARQVIYNYAANGIDVTSVQVATASGNATSTSTANVTTVVQYGGYSNHLPGNMTDAAGAVTTFAYADGLVTQVVAGSGSGVAQTTYINRDGNGFVTSVARAGSGVSGNATVATMSYSGGLLATSADAQGFGVTSASYDGLRRPTSVTYTDGTTEAWSYDILNLASHTDRQGRTTAYTHDAMGRVLTETDAAGRTTSYAWCGCGALLNFTDPGGRKTSFGYDLAGRQLTKTLADGSVYSRTLDVNGRVLSAAMPSGASAAYGLRKDGSVANITYSGTGAPDAVSFEQDALFGYVTSVTQSNNTIAYTHGGVGSAGALQVTSVNGTWANDTIRYDYDVLGRVTGRAVKTDGNVTIQGETYALDALNRVTGSNTTLGNFTFAYLGNTSLLASAAYPNGMNTTMGYFAAGSGGWLANITNNMTVANVTTLFSKFVYQHRGDGSISVWDQEFGWAPGVTGNIGATQKQRWTFTYDGTGWLTGAVLGMPLSGNVTALKDTIQDWVFGYDGSGNQKSSAVNKSGWADQFNDTNELIDRGQMGPTRLAGIVDKPATVTVNGEPTRQWALPGGRDWAFEAKVLAANTSTQNITINATDQGNRTTSQVWRVDNLHTASNFTYNADGSMLTRSDNEGSNITAANITYTWDSLGRITGYNNGTANVTFGYDPLGRRNQITATIANVTTTEYYLWDGAEIIQRRLSATGSANITRLYYDAGFQTMNGTTVIGNYFYTGDHLGSVREVVAGNGTLMGRYAYDAWGDTVYMDYAGNISLQPNFGYAGYFRTSVVPSTYLTLFRPYLPELRRWGGRDPIGEAGGINLYGYVGNDPVNGTDPYGLFVETLVAADAVATATSGGAGVTMTFIISGGPPVWFIGTVALASVPVYINQYLFVDTIRMELIAGQNKIIARPKPSPTPKPALAPPAPSSSGARGKPPTPPKMPTSASECPGDGWEWRGDGPVGSPQGNWHNPRTGESFRLDLNHPKPIGPHADYRAPDGTWYRVYPDGTIIPK